ncbi:tetratricopeptide repeat protein, partial [Nonomuraea sp. NPDC005983]|uniref:tetratricopeptide repeat protein n=1 Tax=Nonomuraea sp. NPDC005983 TaxID=3155595 RepID=UPI0033A8EB2C
AAVTALPVPLADPEDPAAGALAGLVGRRPQQLVTEVAAMPRTPETRLTLARLLAEQASPDAADALDEADAALPGDWRVTWYRGVHALACGDVDTAVPLFDASFSLLPGECAPKLALAFALECAGQDATGWYESVWRTDHSYVSAAFGLARAGRMGVLDEVPTSSSHRLAAQQAMVAAVARQSQLQTLTHGELTASADRLADLTDLDARRREHLTAELLETALSWLEEHGSAPPDLDLAGAEFTERGVRKRLETLFRRLAVAADTRQERHALVDQANAVRPRTWL